MMSRKKILFFILLCFWVGLFSKAAVYDGNSIYEPYSPDGVPFVVATESWNPDGLGNHRALVRLPKTASQRPAVEVVLRWRRPDLRANTKGIRIFDTVNDNEVENYFFKNFSNEEATLCFAPFPGVDTYYIYYMPYQLRYGSHDARYGKLWDDYFPASNHKGDAWFATLENTSLPQAHVERFEARSRFEAFTSMGHIATRQEQDSLLRRHTDPFLVFPEDRAFPARLTNELSIRWGRRGPSSKFEGQAQPDEYYVWQLGIWAVRDSLSHLHVEFSDWKNAATGSIVSRDSMTCFNQEGINWDGQPMKMNVCVPKGKVQTLWCGVQLPREIPEGVYEGQVKVVAEGQAPKTVQLRVRVEGNAISEHGDNDLWRHARLRWLNSRIGFDNHPISPFGAIQLKGHRIIASEKQVRLNSSGLPISIRVAGREVLSRPISFVVETSQGDIIFKGHDLKIKSISDGLVEWVSSGSKQGLSFSCKAQMEYDGYMNFRIHLSSTSGEMKLRNVRLETDYSPYASRYLMGMGLDGGLRPRYHEWHWQGFWDSYWMTGAHAGLNVEFRGGTYHGPLMRDYSPQPPRSWYNEGRGSIVMSGDSVRETSCGSAHVVAQTGPVSINENPLEFEFALIPTPTKPIDTKKQFSMRFFHNNYLHFDEAARDGANIANLHHATPLNPVINYPFIVQDKLCDFIDHEHAEGRKVKLYYTVRELSNYVAEIYALKSLGHEIFASGPGYGAPWHHEHMIDDYRGAWYVLLPDGTADAAMVLSSFSRWINYYLEGLRWLFQHDGIDGIYMDDVSFDRTIMKRIRKIMERYHDGALIDLHSHKGYSNGPANQYAGFFPYVDRLWFGEGFEYNDFTPDEWFIQFSGIPLGPMSEMLEGGGNPWLGTVYGATGRHSYGPVSPVPIWALWRDFGIEESRMSGYWDDDCPVRTDDADVKATVYIRPDRVLIALGNFSKSQKSVTLQFDWKGLGMKPNGVRLYAPEIKDIQPAADFQLDQPITIKAKQGWQLLLERNK